MNNFIIGYLTSVIAGAIVTYFAREILHRLIKKKRAVGDPLIQSITWIPITIGILERALITTLVGFNVPGAAAFMAAWVAVKALHGWGRTKGKDSIYIRGKLFVGFINSLISMIFGVVGGLIFRFATYC